MSIEKFSLEQRVNGEVVKFSNPYFEVMVEDQLGKVFIKNMDTKFIDQVEAEKLVGQTFEFIIEEIVEHAKPHYPGLILNRRILLEEEIKKIIESLNVGDDIEVSELVANKGGANFTFQGIRGFIPLKDLSHSYITNSEKAIADLTFPLNVKITSIDLIGGIYNIVGSVKANLESPMEKIKDLNVGDNIEISEIVPNKGGVSFEYNGVRGFVPLKDISHEFSTSSEQAIASLEMPVAIKIVEIENKNGFVNIIGSIKANLESPMDKIKDLNIGDSITIEEFEPNKGGLNFTYNTIRGFIPLSEISHKFNATSEGALAQLVTPTNVVVTEIAENRGFLNIIGSIKAGQDDLYTSFKKMYQIDEVIPAVINRIEEFGYIVEFANGYNTLLHISQFSEDIKNNELNVHDEINVKLVSLDDENQRIQVTTIFEQNNNME